jgi:signal transduction histidine kinase
MTEPAIDAFDFDESDERIPTGVHSVPTVPLPIATMRPARVVPQAQLMCVTGLDVGRVFTVNQDALLIGRDAGASIHMNVSDVSRRHAQIAWRDGAYYIEDLGSANGTFVNGEPVRRALPLRFGDRVQIGASTILVLGAHDELAARAAQLRQLQAMEDVVAGLASDFNSALMVIVGALDELDGPLVDADANAREALDDARDAASAATRLAARLVGLHKRGATAGTRVELSPLLARVLEDSALPETIATTVDVDARVQVRGTPSELQEVFAAVIANARDATPAGGGVSITAHVASMTPAEALARHLPHEGVYAEIVVADTGHGMEPATLARAFEPFFTTRPRGYGAGLGLSMVHSTVRRHGGAVIADSAAGRGTTVRIWLPALAADAGPKAWDVVH